MTTDVRYFSNWEKYITSQISLVHIIPIELKLKHMYSNFVFLSKISQF